MLAACAAIRMRLRRDDVYGRLGTRQGHLPLEFLQRPEWAKLRRLRRDDFYAEWTPQRGHALLDFGKAIFAACCVSRRGMEKLASY